MANESVSTVRSDMDTRVQLPANLCIEIGKAASLSRLALQEISGRDATDLDKVFASSQINADDFIFLLIGLRDSLNEICRIGGC